MNKTKTIFLDGRKVKADFTAHKIYVYLKEGESFDDNDGEHILDRVNAGDDFIASDAYDAYFELHDQVFGEDANSIEKYDWTDEERKTYLMIREVDHDRTIRSY